MTPEKMPLPAVMVRFWPPRITLPLPLSALMDVPLVREMSKVPVSATPDEFAMLPLPDKARTPELILVAARIRLKGGEGEKVPKDWLTVPAPVMALLKVVASVRSKERLPALLMLPAIEPLVSSLPICRPPPEVMVVIPK